MSLPFAAGIFDVVTLWDVVEHLPCPEGALAEARRVLRPGGLLAFSTPNDQAKSVLLKGNQSTQFTDDTHISLRTRSAWEYAIRTAGFNQLLLGTDAHWDTPYPSARMPRLLTEVMVQVRFATTFASRRLKDGENLVGLYRRGTEAGCG